MKIITTLFIKIPEEMQETIAEEKMLEMEEDLQKISPKTLVEILQKGIFLFREELSGTEKVTFADYMEEGKYMKNFLLQNALATEENYKTFFVLQEREIANDDKKSPNMDDLDAMIAIVDKNDPKLLEVLAKLEKLKKK